MQIKNTNVTISITEMERSITFYLSIGFELIKNWGNHYAQLKANGIVIGLHPSNTSQIGGSGNVSLGFTIDNLNATKLLLDGLNIKTTERIEEGGKFIHFTDPDGTLLYFIEPKS